MHRRFSIIDPTAGAHQPFVDPSTGVCVTLNGEVYNYVELREELAGEGRPFRTRSDTEVLVQAYLRWGDAFLERLTGFWALALYDPRDARLLLARDRLGKAALYVRSTVERLMFASEIKAILPPSRRTADSVRAEAVAQFVTSGLRDVENETFYAGVTTFPAASFCWVSPSDPVLRPRRYWQLPTKRLRASDLSPDEAATELRTRLREAVRLRLRADAPIAFELSGGLDTSSIVALAKELGAPITVYTASFPGSAVDEEGYARAVVRHLGLPDYRVVVPREDDLLLEGDRFFARMDEPFHSPSLCTSNRVAREMARNGFRATMNGAAGDEVLAGYPPDYFYPFLAEIALSGRLGAAFAESRAWSEADPGEPVTASIRRVLAAVALRVPGRLRFLRARNFRQLSGWLEPILAMPLRLRVPPSGGLRTQLALDLTDWKMNHWLRAGHQSYMSIPVEMRIPFLDHRVVEWGASLPPEFLIRQGWHKWVLRRAMEHDLPSEVTWRRRKAGYPFPLEPWLAKHKAALLSLSHTPDGSVLRLKALGERYDLLCREAPDVLWRLLSVALWWKRCVLNSSLSAEPCAA